MWHPPPSLGVQSAQKNYRTKDKKIPEKSKNTKPTLPPQTKNPHYTPKSLITQNISAYFWGSSLTSVFQTGLVCSVCIGGGCFSRGLPRCPCPVIKVCARIWWLMNMMKSRSPLIFKINVHASMSTSIHQESKAYKQPLFVNYHTGYPMMSWRGWGTQKTTSVLRAAILECSLC